MTSHSKKDLRLKLKKIRKTIVARSEKEAQLISNLKTHPRILSSQTIALFWPLASEIDLRDMGASFIKDRKKVCLPVTIAKDQPLVFRNWPPGERMETDLYHIPVPHQDQAEIIPEIIIVPLLGFTSSRFRLGYGGGFYDRTLEKLRKTPQVYAIGIGFDEQEREDLPCDPFDQRLDCVVTPTRLF